MNLTQENAFTKYEDNKELWPYLYVQGIATRKNSGLIRIVDK